MKFFALLMFICSLTIAAFSQTTAYNQRISYRYFNKDWTQESTKEGAMYVRAFIGVDTVKNSYEVRDYTIKGELLSIANSTSREYLLPEGLCTWYNQNRRPVKIGYYTNGKPTGKWADYYNNGQMKRQYTFRTTEEIKQAGEDVYSINNSWDSAGLAEVKDGNGWFQKRDDTTGIVLAKGMIRSGLHHGHWEGFSENGQKTYEEEYADGKFIKGLRFEDGGQPVEYDQLAIPPSYPGGEKALMKFLIKNIKYPKYAQEKGYSGTVIIQFIAGVTGELTNISLHEGVERSLNEEAMRVVKLMPAWIPGKIRGKVEPAQFKLPLRFTIRD